MSPHAAQLISQVYVGYYNRAPDAAGLNYWVGRYNAGMSLGDIAQSFSVQTESLSNYAYLANPNVASASTFLTAVYANLFNRAPDADGLAYWTTQLSSGKSTVGNAIINIISGAQDTAATKDLTTVTNKMTAGLNWATTMANIAGATYGVAEAASAKAIVAAVTSDAATITTASAATSYFFTNGGGAPSITTALTTAANTVIGTSANDVVSGYVNYTASSHVNSVGSNSTFTNLDTITGNGGNDTLALTVDGAMDNGGAAVALPLGNVSGVQTFNIRNITTAPVNAADILTVDASQYSGLSKVMSDRSTREVDIANLKTGSTVGVTGNGTVQNGDIKGAYASSATVANILADGGSTQGTITITGAGITTANISSTGASNILTAIDVAGATTINVNATTGLDAPISTTGAASIIVSGAGAVKLGALDTDVTKVDASNSSGGVSLSLSGTAQTITGGSGNDTITTNSQVTTKTVDAGAGTADKLIVSATTDVVATPAAFYKNFEVLQNSTTGSLDVSLFTGSTFSSAILNGSGASLTKMSATLAAAITNIADNASATLALADATGSSDVLTVTLKNSTSTLSADLTNVTINGFETMNVVSSSGLTAAGGFNDINALSFTSADKLTALNLSGAAPISVVATNIAKAVTIDASALTAVPVVAGTDYTLTESGTLIKGSVVNGSAQADSFTLAAITGTAGDFVSINAGAGNDIVSTTTAILNNTSAANGSFKLDGGAGTDTLSITGGGATLVDSNFQYVTNFEAVKVAAAGAVSITSGGFFDANFKSAGVTITATSVGANAASIDLTSFSGKATVSLTSTPTTQNTLVNGGSNDDAITVDAHTATSGNLTIAGGAGNDTIKITSAAGTLTTGTISIDGGAGQDSITITSGPATTLQNLVTITEHAGQSTLTAYDSVKGYALSDGTTQGYTIDFDGTATVASNASAQAITGYTSAQLTYTISNGLLTFAGTSASALTFDQKASLAQQIVTTADKAVVFTQTNSDSTVDTYVFEHNTGGDSLVKLTGVTGLGTETTAGHTTGFVTIA